MDILALSKFLPFVPAVGAVFLVIAAFYSKTVLNSIGRGVDKISSLSKVPNKDRMHTIEIFENVLKIDEIKTERLTADQRFKLIERTFEERRDAARRRFIILILLSIVLMSLSAFWLYYALSRSDGADKELTRLIQSYPNDVADALARRGFYSTQDGRLVETLARATGFSEDDLNEAIDRFQKMENCDQSPSTGCNRTLAELRSKARDREPPFNEPGMYFDVGRSQGVQPRRFFINVTSNFPFKQSALEVRNPRNGRTLVLWPRTAITTQTRSRLVHLNDQQILQLFGQKELTGTDGTASTIRVAIRPIVSSNPQLTDPGCAAQWVNNDRLCKVDGEDILLNKLLDKLSA